MTDPHNARACACIRAPFTLFGEKVDTALGPAHLAVAIGERTPATKPFFQNAQKAIEPQQIIKPRVFHGSSIAAANAQAPCSSVTII